MLSTNVLLQNFRVLYFAVLQFQILQLYVCVKMSLKVPSILFLVARQNLSYNSDFGKIYIVKSVSFKPSGQLAL